MAKRIFSLFLCCLLLVPCLAVPAKADGIEINFGIADLFDWAYHFGVKGSNYIFGIFNENICRKSPNTDGRHNFVERHTQIDGEVGYYYICEYCGKSAGEVGREAYDDYTASLPVTGYSSSGALIWYPFSSFTGSGRYYFNDKNSTFSSLPIVIGAISSSGPRATFECSSSGDYIVCTVYNYAKNGIFAGIGFDVSCPISGSYRSLGGTYCSFSLSLASYGVLLQSALDEDAGKSFNHYNAGDSISKLSRPYGQNLFDSGLYGYGPKVSYGILNLYFTPYEIIPDSAINSSDGPYSVTTRPTSITGGNYGIVGDNGQITTVTNNTSIVNETNNTYYNPATGKTETINSWTYDYSDRSYNITLESGDTITVTYGDQNITIIEGGDTYIIYYIIDGSGSGSDPGPGSGDDFTHEWYQTGHVQGDCLTPEQRTYTCSLCGKQYTETDPVLGHSWRVIQTVSPEYDDDGNLVQEGYTVYECERCGEQYKSTNDTGPPAISPGDDVDDGGLIGWINSLIKSLSDNLSGAVDLILSFFRKIPELFGGFLDFLSAMFPFLPEEIIALLTFGMAAVVFIGIIKAIRR